jgi:hypothetical protein
LSAGNTWREEKSSSKATLSVADGPGPGTTMGSVGFVRVEQARTHRKAAAATVPQERICKRITKVSGARSKQEAAVALRRDLPPYIRSAILRFA